MEEQNTAEQEVKDTPITEEVAEESQSEVSDTDVVSEEEADVQEMGPEAGEVPKESDGEKPQEESSTEEEIPFTERPGVKERLANIEEKYWSKATSWDTIVELAQNDPDFRVAIFERLEASGKLPKGTTEVEKKKVSSLKDSKEYVDQLPQDIQDDLAAIREFREQREAQQKEEMQKAEEFFVSFEADRPDIAETPDPGKTRSLIFNLASSIAETTKKPFDDAMEEAYQAVVHPGLGEGEDIRRKVQQVQEDASGAPVGGLSKTSRLRKLTQEEKRAAELAGMTHEEYIKYSDTPEEELFENI